MAGLATASRFDLHLHSTRSDGALSPDALVEKCLDGGLQAVALTDHDLSTDVPVGKHTRHGRTVHVIGGAEVSGVHEGREYHLLVYFPRDIPDSFRTFCNSRARERAVRYEHARTSLGLHGIPEADEASRSGERAHTRHHLARHLVDAGHATDLREAFRAFTDHAHGHVPTVTLPFVDAIRIAREAGGVTSWAHPPLSALNAHLKTFINAGLQGLEGLRPMQATSYVSKVKKLARKHGLFLTGGSDWHGWRDADLGLFYVDRASLDGFLSALDA